MKLMRVCVGCTNGICVQWIEFLSKYDEKIIVASPPPFLSAEKRIRQTLEVNRLNNKARFVEMQLSNKGFQVSRS